VHLVDFLFEATQLGFESFQWVSALDLLQTGDQQLLKVTCLTSCSNNWSLTSANSSPMSST